MQQDETQPIDKIVPALLKAAANIKKAEKDGVNTHLNRRYTTLGSVLDACRDALLAEGIFIMQTPFSNPADCTVSVITTLIHASGQRLTSGEGLAVSVANFNAQTVGGAITYLRRYTLCAMLGIVADEDDDGHGASHTPPSRPPQGQPQGRNQPQGSQKGQAPVKPRAEGQTASGGQATAKDDVDFGPFWKLVGQKKENRELAQPLVTSYHNGEYGPIGSDEAWDGLMAALLGLKLDQRQQFPRSA